MEKRRRVTSIDVAKASGVSQATVSYVLNNVPGQSIGSETRAKVLKAAQTLGYRPFTPARDLRVGHSQLILAVIPFEQIDPALARGLKTLQGRLAMQGLSLIWHVGVHPAALSLHPSAHLTPAVVISAADEDDPETIAFLQPFNAPVVPMLHASSRQTVGRTQIAYLVQRGHHRAVFAAPERPDLQRLALARLEGVRQGCEELALAPPFVQVVPSTREGARDAIADLLAHQALPFGVCCYNDEVAFAVLSALSDAGVPIPASAAVIGCDDIPLAQLSTPSLTTIRFDQSRSDDLLIDNVLAAMRGEPMREAQPLTPSVVARGSA